MLAAAERRSEQERGNIVVQKLFEPESDFYLVSARIDLLEGLPLVSHRLSFHKPEDYDGLEEFENELVNESYALFKAGELRDALEVVNKLLTVIPSSVRGLANKGAIVARMGRPEEAIALYDLALQADRTYVHAMVNKAGSLINLGRFQEAFTVCEDALSLAPSDAAAFNNKGIALDILGQLDQAYACFEQAVQLDPTLAESWNGRGGVLYGRAMQKMSSGREPSQLLLASANLKVAAPAVLLALKVRPGYERAHENLRIAVRSILELLPRAFVCKPEVLEAAELDGEAADELRMKLFRAESVRLRPEYLLEVGAAHGLVVPGDPRNIT